MRDMTKVLKRMRENKGLSLRGVAKLSGVPLATLSKLENGVLRNPTLRTMVALKKAYGLELQDWE